MQDHKSPALTRVLEDIHRGDLGKARDRLHGLVARFPDDLSLRTRLAEVYSELKYPRMAGDVSGDGRADVVGCGHQGTYVSVSDW